MTLHHVAGVGPDGVTPGGEAGPAPMPFLLGEPDLRPRALEDQDGTGYLGPEEPRVLDVEGAGTTGGEPRVMLEAQTAVGTGRGALLGEAQREGWAQGRVGLPQPRRRLLYA